MNIGNFFHYFLFYPRLSLFFIVLFFIIIFFSTLIAFFQIKKLSIQNSNSGTIYLLSLLFYFLPIYWFYVNPINNMPIIFTYAIINGFMMVFIATSFFSMSLMEINVKTHAQYEIHLPILDIFSKKILLKLIPFLIFPISHVFFMPLLAMIRILFWVRFFTRARE